MFHETEAAKAMNIFGDSEEEDNNPFSGTDHLYASGIAAVPEGQDDFFHSDALPDVQEKEETRDELMHQLFGSEATIKNSEPNASIIATQGTSQDADSEDFGSSIRPLRSPVFTKQEQPIKILDAGHYRDPYGKHAIGYTISYEEQTVTRRYSEFDTLRHSLCRLLPTVVVPPIPSKHPLIRYFLNPLNAEKDIKIIDKRKRLLASFLNNCIEISEIREHVVFKKFLDPEHIWRNVLNSPPISIIPMNNLLAPPLQPTKPSPLHLLLPNPTSATGYKDITTDSPELIELESEFMNYEKTLKSFEKLLDPFEKHAKQNKLHFRALASSLAELGAYYNAFSLEGNIIALEKNMKQIEELSRGIEKIGQAVDVNYVSSEILTESIATMLEEPIGEMIHFITEAYNVLHFRKLKRLQFYIIDSTIKARQIRINDLKSAQEQMDRLEEALKRNAEESPTIAQAMQKIESTASNAQTRPGQLSQNERRGWTELFKSRGSKGSKSRKAALHKNDIEPHLLSDDERNEEVAKISRELEKLSECFRLITKDMNQVNDSISNSIQRLLHHFKSQWGKILKELTRVLLVWLKDCLLAWQNARKVIGSISIDTK